MQSKNCNLQSKLDNKKNLSQEELAALVGVTRQTIYQGRQRTLTSTRVKWGLLTAVVAAAVGMLLALLFLKG